MRRAGLLFGFCLAITGCSSCSRGTDGGPATQGSVAIPLAASATQRTPLAPGVAIDFVAGFDDCTLGHRGVLLDLGDATLRARMSGTKLAPPDVEPREHEGASWAQVRQKSLDLSWVSTTEVKEAPVVIEARVRGGLAKSASVYLGGKGLGTLPFTKGEAKIVSLQAPVATIQRGANELVLRFNGAGKAAPHDALAEIDWIRVGPVDNDGPYAAPTRSDALTTVTLAGVARRGLSLRAPGFARCSGYVPKGAVLEGFIGTSGGEAEAEVRVIVDRAEPRVVANVHLPAPQRGEGATRDGTTWRPLSVPLGDVGALAAVELVAKSSGKGARVVFAEPKVVTPTPPPDVMPPKSRAVVLVVLGTTVPRALVPWGGKLAVPELTALADRGMLYELHRATSSLANASVASMLTGLPPRDHGVESTESMLSPHVLTLASAARQAGVVTAMFTANPTTSATFGFERGFETFQLRSPTEEGAVAVFDDASKWMAEHKNDRVLVVIHARGGHPPWDATADELKSMAPPGYAGSLEAKHGAEMLAKARKAGNARLFADPDRERAFALHDKALAAHDAALGRLVAAMRALGRDADTTWIVTGDVGFDPAAHVPFLDDETLHEAALSIPLVVRGNLDAPPPRARVPAATTSLDVARTALEALGLTPPPAMRGTSLVTTARRNREVGERALVATAGNRFSGRWAGFVLAGAKERETKLCNLALEPDCASDVRPTHPLAAELLHGLAFGELARPAPKQVSEVPTKISPDGPATTALKAWGR